MNVSDVKAAQEEVSRIQNKFMAEGKCTKEEVDNMLNTWKSLASMAESAFKMAPFGFRHGLKNFMVNAQKLVAEIERDLNDENKFTIENDMYIKNPAFDMNKSEGV
jgi:hypothetical protein